MVRGGGLEEVVLVPGVGAHGGCGGGGEGRLLDLFKVQQRCGIRSLLPPPGPPLAVQDGLRTGDVVAAINEVSRRGVE
jgi:hypothetical protein